MIKIRREQIAGMNMHYKYRTLDYFFKTQQALGIKNIEFWCARPHFLLDDYGFEDAAELKECSRLWIDNRSFFTGVYDL